MSSYLDSNGLLYFWQKIKAHFGNLIDGKVDKVTGKGLSTNDYTTAEQTKLSGIAAGAEVNQNAFSNVTVGSSTIASSGKTDTIELVAGDNITLTPDTSDKSVTIAAAPAELTILSYGHSTWNDFITAYQHHAIVYCRASSGSNPGSGSQTRMAFMAYVNNADNPTEVEFQYYRSVATHSDSQQGDQVFVYKLTSNGSWTVTTREAASKIAVSTGISKSYSSGTITLSLNQSTVQGLIDSSIANLVDATTVQSMIDTSTADFVDSTTIQSMIDTSISGLVDATTVQSMIDAALANVLTVSSGS